MTTTLAASVFERLGDELWLLVPALAFALVASALIGRVLGVRRSFAATLVSGTAGWVIGVVVALWIAADTHPASDGFGRNLFLFSLLGAMAVAVWLEFLARPGVLVRAQTGLQSVPHPVRSLRRRGRRVQRYAEITRIAVRNGLGPSLGLGRKEDVEAAGARPPVRRLRLALEECGGMFVKLGQVLSTRTDLISPQAAAELGLLQDHVRPAPRDAIAEVLEEELDTPVPDVFPGFDWHPLAAASIGQVYRAQLPDGSPVVVKVQRPGIDESVRVDLSVLEELGHVVESRTTWGASTGSTSWSTSSRRVCARSSTTGPRRATRTPIASTMPADAHIRVPYVYEELSTSRVLVMEWLDGTSVREVDWAAARIADRVKLADSLLQAFLEQMLQEGVFHADPHPGNVMLLADGHLALIDFGAAGRLDPVQQAALRDLMAGVSRRDADAVVQAVLQVASLRRGVDVNDFERALARFMAQHLAPGSQPDAAMFNAMLRLMFDYGITMPAEWSTFFRALIVLEGTLTTIAPGYSVIDAAEGIAAKWVRSLINPSSMQQALRDELLRTVPMLRRLPAPRRPRVQQPRARRPPGTGHALLGRARRARRRATRQPRGPRVPLRRHRPRVGRPHRGSTGGPAFSDRTSLFRVLGYFGLFCATVLAMRVIVAVLRDGLN